MTPIIAVQPYGSSFVKALEKITHGNPAVSAVECDNAKQAIPIALNAGRSLLLCHASKQEDIVQVAMLIKVLREQSRGQAIRVLVTIKLPGAAGDIIAEKLRSFGAHEVVREPVVDRLLAFKLDRHLKALPKAPKAGEQAAADAAAARTLRSRQGAARAGNSTEIKRSAALDFESDCYLFGKGNGTKKVGGRWIVRMVGPGPLAGRWVEAGSDGRGEQRFRWTPHDAAKDPFVKDPGGWIFTGIRMPEFVNELWNFAGKMPRLEFYAPDNQQVVARKFSTLESGALEVTQDSQYAMQLLAEIRQTFQRVIRSEVGGPEVPPEGAEAEAPSESASDAADPDGQPRKRRKAVGAEEGAVAGDRGSAADLVYIDKHEERGLEIRDRRKSREGGGSDGPEDYVDEREEQESADDGRIRDETPSGRELSAERGEADVLDFRRRKSKKDGDPAAWNDHQEGDDAEDEEAGSDAHGEAGNGSRRRRRDGRPGESDSAADAADPEAKLEEGEAAASGAGSGGAAKDPKASEDAPSAAGGEAAAKSEPLPPIADQRAPQPPGSEHLNEYLYPLPSFGTLGGEWELVFRDPVNDARCFVYVAPEILQGTADPKALAPYWTWKGEAKPRLSGDRMDWVFLDHRPERHEAFGDLSEPVARYLLDRAKKGVRAEDAKDSATAEGATRGEAAVAASAQQALEDIRADVKRRMKEKREREATTAADQPAPGTEGGAPGAVDRPSDAAASEAVDPVRTMRAEKIARPTLGPLALAFLMSELLANRKKFDLENAARRYCEYVASAVGGLRVELWISADAAWRCTAVSEGSLSEARPREPLAGEVQSGARLHAGRTWIGGVAGPDGRVLGALLIDGEGADGLNAEYVEAVAAVTQGVLFRLREGGESAAKAA